MIYQKKNIPFFILLFFSLLGKTQNQNIPLNREFGLVNQKVFNGKRNNSHTSFLPINESSIRSLSDSDLSNSEKKCYLNSIEKASKKPNNFLGWLYRTAFYENFLVVDTGDFYLTIDPLINLELGKDQEDDSGKWLYKNTRGAIVRANVGDHFSLETSFYESQAVLPQYLDDYAQETSIIPGQGRWKNFKGDQGYDFSSANANLTYSPNKYFIFQLGTGKNFIGDGYRSLLLSDQSFNYPFWKITTTFGKKEQFQYTKLNASLSSVTRRERGSTGEALFQRKTMSTHYLSWLATKWLNLGFFESTLWQTEDDFGTKPINWQQFNPIIGINTLTTGFNSPNHSVVGTNLKIKLPFKTNLYNQFIFDGKKRYGYQIGLSYFGIKNLNFQLEHNLVQEDTYSSAIPLQTYSNYNEFLAHPSGNNFNESILLINYKYKRIFTQLKWNQISYNTTSTFPTNFSNQRIINLQAHLGFLINAKTNLNAVVGVNQRIEKIDSYLSSNSIIVNERKTNYIYFGIRTSLLNLYNDF